MTAALVTTTTTMLIVTTATIVTMTVRVRGRGTGVTTSFLHERADLLEFVKPLAALLLELLHLLAHVGQLFTASITFQAQAVLSGLHSAVQLVQTVHCVTQGSVFSEQLAANLLGCLQSGGLDNAVVPGMALGSATVDLDHGLHFRRPVDLLRSAWLPAWRPAWFPA
jgi:hypothetical protein